MSFDNRVFDVNGATQEQLRMAFKLAFAQNGHNTKAKYWTFDKKNGLVLHWYVDEPNANTLPVPLDAEAAADLVWQWLTSSDDAKTVELEGWFRDEDHDGSNSPGWRAYVGNWGHVSNYHGSIIAVTPAYLWHGK